MLVGYKNLEVYQRSFRLAVKLHSLTQSLPEFEKYELGSQLRRSAISVVLNITEDTGEKIQKGNSNIILEML